MLPQAWDTIQALRKPRCPGRSFAPAELTSSPTICILSSQCWLALVTSVTPTSEETLTPSLVRQEHNHVSISDPRPTPIPEDPAPEPREEWKTGLFSVTAEPGGSQLCLMATLCPCIVFGQTVGRLDPADVPLGGNKWGATLVYSLCPSVAAVSTRAGIRRKYNLRGSLLEDCLTSLGCGCCALIQVQRPLHIGTRHPRLRVSDCDGVEGRNQQIPNRPDKTAVPAHGCSAFSGGGGTELEKV